MSVDDSVLAVSAGGATVNADNPWPGLFAFRETDQDYFHGRQPETEDLLRVAMRERLTVLFGASGLGKSSLLQAGLFPRLRRENVFPVYVLLNFSSGRPLAAQVNDVIAAAAVAHEIEAPSAQAGESLWQYFHREGHHFWSARNRPMIPMLVFDQFEEIFTHGRLDAARSEATDAFVDQLADLAEGRPPAALKAWIDLHPEKADEFLFGQHHYKILLSIREDFLPELEGLRARMPAVALNRMRLRRMNGEAALLAVNQAQQLIDEDVAVQVVRFVAADRGQLSLAELEVEPALLSVVCRELNNKRQNQSEPKITADLLEGNQERVLSDFYERSMADLPHEVRRFVEDHLLTVSGYRDSVAVENALSARGVSREALDQLVKRRLVRREDRGGAARLELTHDLLAGVVRASRDSRRQREETERQHLAQLRSQEEQQQALLKANEEERLALQRAQQQKARERDRRELRSFRIATVVVLIFAIAAIGAAGWAWRERGESIAAERKARDAQAEAESQRAQAERAQTEAESQRAQADRARADAESQRAQADRARAEAESQRAQAERAQAEAESQRVQAERAQAEAESQRVQAERAQAEAESQRAQAERAKREAEELRQFTLGGVTLTIPSPKGFQEVIRRYEARERFPDVGEVTTIAVHVPSSFVKDLAFAETWPYYAVVQIHQGLKGSDISDAAFAALALDLTRQNPNEALKSVPTTTLDKRGITLSDGVNLGPIGETQHSMTLLYRQNVTDALGKKFAVMFTLTALHVRRRVILVNAYHIDETPQVRALLEGLARDWTNDILASNPD